MNFFATTAKLLVMLCSIGLYTIAQAQTEQFFINECLRLQAAFNDAAAANIAEEGIKNYASSYDLLAHLSFSNSALGLNSTDKKSQAVHYSKAEQAAKKLIALYPKKDLPYVAKAIALGGMALSQPAKTKVDAAYQIRYYLDTALSINRGSYFTWHALGRWYYEMASIGKFNRFMASIFVKEIPAGSFQDAVKFLTKSSTLNPEFVGNYYFLAMSYKKIGNQQAFEAAKQRGLKCKPNSATEQALLSKLKAL